MAEGFVVRPLGNADALFKVMSLEVELVQVIARELVNMGLDPTTRIMPGPSGREHGPVRQIIVYTDKPSGSADDLIDREFVGVVPLADTYSLFTGTRNPPSYVVRRQVVEIGAQPDDVRVVQQHVLNTVREAVDRWYNGRYKLDAGATAVPTAAAAALATG